MNDEPMTRDLRGRRRAPQGSQMLGVDLAAALQRLSLPAGTRTPECG